MKKTIKILAYINFFISIFISIILKYFFSYLEPNKAMTYSMYSLIAISLVILIFDILIDTKKILNCIILAILNLLFFLLPGSIFYFYVIHYSDLTITPFGNVNNISYINYIVNFFQAFNWIAIPLFINIITILLAILDYSNHKNIISKNI